MVSRPLKLSPSPLEGLHRPLAGIELGEQLGARLAERIGVDVDSLGLGPPHGSQDLSVVLVLESDEVHHVCHLRFDRVGGATFDEAQGRFSE